jgi:hypothetical protein
MSKEPGQLAYEKSRPSWLWCEISVSERKIWAAVEAAIRADEAAKAAGAYAEREKELVEALEKIATDCEADGPGTIHEGLAKFARAILSKHKAPA